IGHFVGGDRRPTVAQPRERHVSSPKVGPQNKSICEGVPPLIGFSFFVWTSHPRHIHRLHHKRIPSGTNKASPTKGCARTTMAPSSPLHILPRQQFGPPFGPPDARGIHPGAIFGIVASVIVILAVVACCLISRRSKKAKANKVFVVDPRTGASSLPAHDLPAPPPPYTRAGGDTATTVQYPPAVAHDLPPEYGYGHQRSESSEALIGNGTDHKTSPGNGTAN
ncbi:hypothetical protein QBC47DRAFT_121347, partial [Echria macrotheca]